MEDQIPMLPSGIVLLVSFLLLVKYGNRWSRVSTWMLGIATAVLMRLL